MNVFQFATVDLGLTPESQGEAAWLRALFTLADGSGANTLTNPYSEVLRRLESQGLDGWALNRVKSLLNSKVEKYSRA